jgi:hypothetical protein
VERERGNIRQFHSWRKDEEGLPAIREAMEKMDAEDKAFMDDMRSDMERGNEPYPEEAELGLAPDERCSLRASASGPVSADTWAEIGKMTWGDAFRRIITRGGFNYMIVDRNCDTSSLPPLLGTGRSPEP